MMKLYHWSIVLQKEKSLEVTKTTSIIGLMFAGGCCKPTVTPDQQRINSKATDCIMLNTIFYCLTLNQGKGIFLF